MHAKHSGLKLHQNLHRTTRAELSEMSYGKSFFARCIPGTAERAILSTGREAKHFFVPGRLSTVELASAKASANYVC